MVITHKSKKRTDGHYRLNKKKSGKTNTIFFLNNDTTSHYEPESNPRSAIYCTLLTKQCSSLFTEEGKVEDLTFWPASQPKLSISLTHQLLLQAVLHCPPKAGHTTQHNTTTQL